MGRDVMDLILVGLFVAGAGASCGKAGMTFDKSVWVAERGNHSGKSRRNAMAGDLPALGVKPGASREQIRALLGEPDSTGPEIDIYYLGRSSVGPSFESYRIDYSADGIVTAAAFRRR